MATRSAAALLVVGDSPTTSLLRDLAAEVGIPLAAAGRRSRIPVVALVADGAGTGTGTRAGGTPPSLPSTPGIEVVFVEPGRPPGRPGAGAPPAGERPVDEGPVDLATDRGHDDRAPAEPWGAQGWSGRPCGAALYAAWSPVVARAGREIAGLRDLRHVDVRVRQPRGDGLPTAVALAAWSLAGTDVATVEATGPSRARVRCGTAVADVDGTPAAVPEWSIQAAAPDAVVRLELAPTPTYERDGRALPLGDAPEEAPAVRAARHLGLIGFLDDLRDGRLLDPRRWPAGAHPGWGRTVVQLLAAHARSASLGGEPVAP